MYTQVWSPMLNAVAPNQIQRDQDGAFIPADDGNKDWRAYQDWLDAGNTPNPPENAPDVPAQGGPSG